MSTALQNAELGATDEEKLPINLIKGYNHA
jgi:hypothetical protein